MRTTRPYCEVDTECDWLWWLCKFRLPDGRMFSFTIDAESGRPLDTVGMMWFIENFTLVTFNGNGYDEPMIRLAMAGANVHRLKQCNDTIIVKKVPPWKIADHFPEMVTLPGWDMVDLMEVAPGVRISLKTYMARAHCPTIQDLPFNPNAPMPYHLRAVTDEYCGNDLYGTHVLRELVADRLALREEIGERYGIDVRSRSDAQMAEDIIKSQLGFKPNKRFVPHGYKFKYEPPEWVRFTTPEMQAVLDTVRASEFVVYDVDQLARERNAPATEEFYGSDGKKIKTGVKMPPELKALKIKRGSSVYKFGIGGLHSQEKAVNHHSIIGKWVISDHDVKSYYPSLILLLRMYPEQLGVRFLEIYQAVYEGRLSDKAGAQQLEREIERLGEKSPGIDAIKKEFKRLKTSEGGNKIVLNGTFGKLFSKYSILFAPELGIKVTLTGQLALLMLIEALENMGCSVISANTDGIVVRTPVLLTGMRDACIAWWEKTTGLEMEANFYRSIFQASVNSYVAIDTRSGKVKRKGFFGKSGVDANAHPDRDISVEAVVAYLTKGTPLMETIRACRDVRMFLTVKASGKGPLEYRGEFLGKSVRWYYGAGVTECLRYAGSGNKVASSDGAVPMMRLSGDTMPADIDYAAYHDYAVRLLSDVGVSYNDA